MARTGIDSEPSGTEGDTPPREREEEDTTPRDTLPDVPRVRVHEAPPSSGWQSDPLPVTEWSAPCVHMGQLRAALQVVRYPLGAEWICTCGQVFVVAINAGGKRTLQQKADVD